MSIEVNSNLATATSKKHPKCSKVRAARVEKTVSSKKDYSSRRDIKKDMMENFFLVEKVH